MDRLRALDLAFLDLETSQAPLQVGWTLRLGGRPPSLAALRRHLDARLHAVPRFRRRLASAPLTLGDQLWADDVAFDIGRHVHAVRVPAPGGTAQLRETASALLSPVLPVDRPLWSMHLVDGLADGWALVGQVHHALVDGVAAVELALLLFDGLDQPGAGAAWRPEPPPALHRLAAHAAAHRVRGAAGLARSAARALAAGDPVDAARDASRAMESALRPAGPTSLAGGATARRAVAWASTPFDAAQEAGRRHGATVNDVLLAAATSAMAAALHRRGERPAAVKALVPVNVRDGAQTGGAGNHISFLPVDLPVGEPDPVVALRRISARTKAAKARGEARPLAALAQAADLLPAGPRRALTRTAARAVSFSVVVSNVPGPPVDLALLGRPLEAILPMVPLLHGQALTIGALSYRGRLHLGLAADEVAVPDVVDVARDLERAFDVLRVAGPPVPPPWRARARERRAARRAVQPAASR
ncbi:MAG TPA: wax ester/triacylglycerol synthase family O-acyltransferase [Baekduia sp.]|nr:wax ester/triacylglycerol synthase family O-acyltransferase [Baekduia sp.]